MNIFFLDKNIYKCAEYHCDKHVIKMILESAQILSTAARYVLNKNDNRLNHVVNLLYKSTHLKHPSVLWACESPKHWFYLWYLCAVLNLEYLYRFRNIDSYNLLNNSSYLSHNSICLPSNSMHISNDLRRSDSLSSNSMCVRNCSNDSIFDLSDVDFINQIYNVELQKSSLNYFSPRSLYDHKSFIMISNFANYLINDMDYYNAFIYGFNSHDFECPPQAMPDEYKNIDTVVGYRTYYIMEKYKIASWTKRNVPDWMRNIK